MTIFVALTVDEVRKLRSDGLRGRHVAYAGTPALRHFHDYDESMTEDADFAAMGYAGVHAVTTRGHDARLVVAFDVPSARVEDARDPYGRVTVSDVTWAEVTALFTDEPGSEQAVAAARVVAFGRDVESALQHDTVAALLDDHDLLWYAPAELDRLL